MRRDLLKAWLLVATLGACAAALPDEDPESEVPSDFTAAQQAEYWTLYQAGYEAMLKGVHSTYCVRGEAARPRQLGWVHGQDAAYFLWHEMLAAATEARDRSQLLALFEGWGDEAEQIVASILAEPEANSMRQH